MPQSGGFGMRIGGGLNGRMCGGIHADTQLDKFDLKSLKSCCINRS